MLFDSLRRWRRLPPAERRIAWRAAVLCARVPIQVRLRGLAAALQPDSHVGVSVAPERIHELTRAVAGRLPWTSSCLTRSLAAARLIASTGGQSDVVIGVAEPGTHLRAHAWLEVCGRSMEPEREPWVEVARWTVVRASHP
jgi:hypothetical protein